MKDFYRNEIVKQNKWIDSKDVYELILTDDIDSLLGCAILKQKRDWNIEQVMLFKANKNKNDGIFKDFLGVTDNSTHESIGVDFARFNGKCFDNHLTKMSATDTYNKESINLNNLFGIHRGIYGRKYNLSTVLLLWSLYDLPKENLSDELMMVLLAIDSSFEGYYNDYFRQFNKKYMVDVLDLSEFYACQERHTYEEFKTIQRKYNLKAKITAKRGYLSTELKIAELNNLLHDTGIQLELPKAEFHSKAVFKDIAVQIKGCPDSVKTICGNPFCYALTKKDFMNYSEMIE